MDWHTFISDDVTMPNGWGNMDDGSQFFYQLDLLYGVKPNDNGMGNDNDQNVGAKDTEM